MQLLLAKQLGQRRPPLMFYSFSLILLASLLALTALAASSPSYYKILDISPDADARTIKKAYRRLAQKLHPDKHPEKEEEFVKMSDAYQVLSDEELRKVYDRYGEEGVKRHQAGRQGGGVSTATHRVAQSLYGCSLTSHSILCLLLLARPTTPSTSFAPSSEAEAVISNIKFVKVQANNSTSSSLYKTCTWVRRLCWSMIEK